MMLFCILQSSLAQGCRSYYYFIDQTSNQPQAKICPNYCSQCNATQCISCCRNFFLSSNNVCVPMPYSCTDMDADATNCKACLPSMYLSANGQCQPCGINCIKCISPTNCSICKYSFYQAANLCKPCLFPNCLNCTQSACTTCMQGFYPNSFSNTTSCIACPTSCQVCLNQSTCLSCINRYYQNSSGACAPCSVYCLNCTSPSQCLSCQNNYAVNFNGTCQICPQFCQTCVNNGNINTCYSCYANNFLATNGNCQSCPQGCIACTNSTFCVICAVSAAVSSTGACINNCPTNCGTCTSSQTCVSCLLPYFLNSQNICQFCGAKCQQCYNQTTCQYCGVGSYVSYGSCHPCNQGCTSCSGQVCNSCQPLLYLNQNRCLPKCASAVPNCYLCDLDSQNNQMLQCAICQEGYSLEKGTCFGYYGYEVGMWILFSIFIVMLAGCALQGWQYWKSRRSSALLTQKTVLVSLT